MSGLPAARGSRPRSLKDTVKALLSPLLMTSGPRGRIYLTFDDGPNPQFTPQVLDALDRYGAKATFFLIGEDTETHPALAAQVVARGHAVGYHSYEHLHRRALTMAAAIRDLETMRTFADRLGIPIALYRPPYGELSIVRLLWCLAHGVRVAMWSLDSGDSTLESAETLARNVSPETVRDGDIILFHDDSPVTAQGLPRVLENLRSAGFVFGTL